LQRAGTLVMRNHLLLYQPTQWVKYHQSTAINSYAFHILWGKFGHKILKIWTYFSETALKAVFLAKISSKIEFHHFLSKNTCT
jgi:hypothetical protein